MHEERVRYMVSEPARAQQKLHQYALRHVGCRSSEGVGVMEAFQVGGYILVARPPKVPPRLVVIWTESSSNVVRGELD